MGEAYKVNTDRARKGSTKSSRIDSTGEYLGVFKEVKRKTARTGTKGIEFKFESVCGRKAEYMTIWTHKADGKVLSGLEDFDAIMIAAKVKECNWTEADGKVYDGSKMIDAKITVAPELIGVPIGLVLQKELYTKNTGKHDFKMNIYLAFNEESRQTAAEMFDAVPSKMVDQCLEYLTDVDSRDLDHTETYKDGSPKHDETNFDFDDDIPF